LRCAPFLTRCHKRQPSAKSSGHTAAAGAHGHATVSDLLDVHGPQSISRHASTTLGDDCHLAPDSPSLTLEAVMNSQNHGANETQSPLQSSFSISNVDRPPRALTGPRASPVNHPQITRRDPPGSFRPPRQAPACAWQDPRFRGTNWGKSEIWIRVSHFIWRFGERG
jgi:hypothetical protein